MWLGKLNEGTFVYRWQEEITIVTTGCHGRRMREERQKDED